MKETFPAGTTTATPPPTAAPAPAPGALRAKVRTLAPSMTRSMRLVAETVAADPAACAALTITALAQRTGTSEATVVRTARTLGYPGYRDLRLALAALAARQEAGTVPSATADIAVDDPLPEVIAKLAHEEQRCLSDTAAQLDAAQLGAAAGALANARRIDIYGIGASALVGQDLALKLLRIGRIAHWSTDPHLAVTSAVQLRRGDVAIGISHSGSTGEVIEPLRVALDHGATTLAVTSRPDSPIARYADLVLTTAAGRDSELRPAAMSTRTSQLLVIDCLFIGVAQRTYDMAAPALAASHEALTRRHSAWPPR